jgi:hypothetical protein
MDTHNYEALAESYARLAREVRAVVASASLDAGGRAVVPVHLLNRLSRELKGEPQPSGAWMSST